ncbi:AEC family transporter [Variovorax sp. dw_954]|uniref:AEC family transporter n=1 Tax=Variovorax sp. dw_954 TaxID=2720078 RepID=UPI001BD2C789|nr:AEC family transporter [Variovorax sp. dw_954]
MTQILGITGPIYLVIALGFLAGRLEIFSKADMRVLGTYVVKFALPALVFTALSQRPVGEILNARYMADYAVGSLIVLLVAFAWGWQRQGKSFTLSALCGLGMSSSNSGFIGYPIAVQVVGPATAAVALAMNMVIENLVMIPITLAMADSGSSGAGKWYRIALESMGKLARNPVILAMLGGFGVALLELPIAGGVLARTINMLAMSSAAVSLFVIGGALVGLPIKGMRRDVSAIALGKLVLHPLVVGLLVWLLPPSDPSLRAAAVVFAGVPMLSIYPILAQKYGFDALCAAALLLATVLSFVTISLLLWSLGELPGWIPAT